MSIEAVARTRSIAAGILADVLQDMEGHSEYEMAESIRAGMASHDEIFAEGWYSPPPAGVSVLIGKSRMGFDSLRKQEYWPSKDIRFEPDSTAMVYLSPVDKETGMIGDIAVTIYRGTGWKMREHLRNGLVAVTDVAKRAEAGMPFSALFKTALDVFAEAGLVHAHVTMTAEQSGTNIGHTVPWSYGEKRSSGDFAAIKEDIRTKRLFINATENFEIPETCAFTVESPLLNPNEPSLPNIYFHVIVTFSEGRRNILSDFDTVFKATGMNYML